MRGGFFISRVTKSNNPLKIKLKVDIVFLLSLLWIPAFAGMTKYKWVISSVGRASPLQGEGRQFEPVITHQPTLLRASAGRPWFFLMNEVNLEKS